MKTSILRKKLESHNRIKLGLTIAFATFSLFLFIVSFYLVKLVFGFILGTIFDGGEEYANWVAVFYLVVLLFEGFRSARYFFEQQSIDESFGTINDIFTGSRFHYDRGWIYMSHLFSHFLFAAPYAGLRALEESQKIAEADDEVLTQASNVLALLEQNPKAWTPAARFSQLILGLDLLHRMGIVWIDSDENGDVCRLADN